MITKIQEAEDSPALEIPEEIMLALGGLRIDDTLEVEARKLMVSHRLFCHRNPLR